MPVLDLVLLVAWVALVAIWPSVIVARAGGTIPPRNVDRRGSPQWWSRRVSSLGFGLALAAPLADLAGLAPVDALDQPGIQLLGVILVVLGTVVTLVSQAAMGAAWRADVDVTLRAPLVTTGPFRVVRNPTFSGTLVTASGFGLLVPNVLSAGMLAAFVLALEIQVRLVEEPHLAHIHGDAYRRYAARTGRFLPGIGRLSADRGRS